MKRLVMYLVVLLFALQTGAIATQEREEPKPTFKLSIEVDESRTRWNPDLHRLVVRFTRVSMGIEVQRFHDEAEGMYNMIVLHDGVLAKETPAMRALRNFRKRDGNPTIRFPQLLKTGEIWITTLDVSDYYEMTHPGTYQVTVTRASDPGNPTYSFLVRSNTVAFVVPQKTDGPSVQRAEKPKPRFGLTISPEDPDEVPPAWILADMQNESQREIRELKCWPFYGMYSFVVRRDGELVDESDAMRTLQAARERVDCPGNETLLEIAPGGTCEDRIPLGAYFDIDKPDSYTVYATRETYPWIPAKSVVVESSTVSFVVPQLLPVDKNPQSEALPSTPQ
ncbi:MAG: hypothetical protein P4L51_11175 [Puia sp.]|nr:hypothetical protein [Puia sp.]